MSKKLSDVTQSQTFIASPEQYGFTAFDIPLVADRKVLLKTKG